MGPVEVTSQLRPPTYGSCKNSLNCERILRKFYVECVQSNTVQESLGLHER